jgi:cytoskeletal protein CcmA (bactofilin family)
MFSKAKAKNPSEEKPRAAIAEMNAAPAPSAAPSKRSGPMKTAGVPSIISSDMVLRGNMTSTGEVQLDGSIEGDIRAGMLIVGEKATVRGEIVCEAVTVRGRVEGGIRAKTVSLAATAHILGDILHSSLSVEAGAHFEGQCRHSDDPLSEAATKDFRKARPTSASAPAPRPVTTSGEDDGQASALSRTPPVEAPSFLAQGAARSPLR